MDDAVFVRILQRLAHGRHHGQCLLGRETSGLHRLPQVDAVHKLHEQKVKSAGLAEVVNGDNARMIERRESLRLVRKALRELRIRHPFRCQQLERDEAVEQFLSRLVNHTHAAAPETFEDFELREMRRQFGRRKRLPLCGQLRVALRWHHRLGHEATRTKPRRGRRWQRRAALRAGVRRGS